MDHSCLNKSVQVALLSQRGRAMLRVCQYLALLEQYVERSLLLLVTSASDLPLRTNKFCSLLFPLADSLACGGLCHKQTCTVTVIHYCTDDCQLWIAHCSSHWSIARYWPKSRFVPTPPAFDAPVKGGGGPRGNIAMTFGTEKLQWFGYPTVKKRLKTWLLLLVSTDEFTNVKDRQTHRHRMTA